MALLRKIVHDLAISTRHYPISWVGIINKERVYKVHTPIMPKVSDCCGDDCINCVWTTYFTEREALYRYGDKYIKESELDQYTTIYDSYEKLFKH